MSHGTELVLVLVAVMVGIGGVIVLMSALAPGRRNRTPDEQARDSHNQHPPRIL
jgi:hypothetical protein